MSSAKCKSAGYVIHFCSLATEYNLIKNLESLSVPNSYLRNKTRGNLLHRQVLRLRDPNRQHRKRWSTKDRAAYRTMAHNDAKTEVMRPIQLQGDFENQSKQSLEGSLAGAKIDVSPVLGDS